MHGLTLRVRRPMRARGLNTPPSALQSPGVTGEEGRVEPATRAGKHARGRNRAATSDAPRESVLAGRGHAQPEYPRRGIPPLQGWEEVKMDPRQLARRPQSDCPHLATETAVEAFEDRLGDPDNVSGGELSSVVDGHDPAIVWVRTLRLGRDGEVVSSPTIEFRTVREAAPRTIRAPDESDHDCQIPVFVMDRAVQVL